MKKHLLITGCSSGFGNALMKTLYKEYNIISLSRRKPKNLKLKEFWKILITILK